MRGIPVVAFACAVGIASADAATITNGSLTGPIANAGVPPGWTILRQSPDTNDVNFNVGGGTPFAVTPSASPDGGTWVGMAGGPEFVVESETFNESFGTTILDLVPGTLYTLSWYGANFGALTGPGYTGSGAIQALIDGTAIGSGALLPLAEGWSLQSVDFTAPGTTAALAFQLDPATLTRSYLSIDGISISAAAAPIPLPAPLLLLLSGLVALGATGQLRRA